MSKSLAFINIPFFTHKNGGLMDLRKVSTHVSLRSPRRLTWAETFRYLFFFSMSKDCSSSRFSQLFHNTDFHGSIIWQFSASYNVSLRTVSPPLSESGSYVMEEIAHRYKTNISPFARSENISNIC